ncbi:hypothetical protein AVEN_66320-1 [Araneus ventricosus]|uniref:Uncharacterized protein n=1 Tax=Araneus ventricosus TaxID=182803 RepID=A0A4Y2U560_ARAVE|nr:hypothetical protein AVEN_66320-1 [Araneus ventricosus]
MASLPPTETADHQHSRRVYSQIQHWLGNKKRPDDWGWKIQVINSDEDDDDEPILPDDLVEASLTLHVEEDTDDLQNILDHKLQSEQDKVKRLGCRYQDHIYDCRLYYYYY